jgi:hypothetical protein
VINKTLKIKDMKKLYTFLSVVAISAAINAQDFTATYDFAGVTQTSGTTDPSTVPTGTNVTFGSFSVVNAEFTGTGSTGAGRFAITNQPLGATTGNDVYTSLTGSIDLNKYFQVVVTPATGFKLTLDQLTFRVQRSGTGVRTYAVRTSADNFAANLGVISIDPANPVLSTQANNVFFWATDETTAGQNGSKVAATTVNDVTTPLTIRFYGWNAEAEGGTFSIDDVVISGSVESTTAGIATQEIAGLKLFPNPLTSGSSLNIVSNNASDKAVAIFDVLGKQVMSATTVRGTVNTSNLTAGVYIVKITEGAKTATRKLVVQ